MPRRYGRNQKRKHLEMIEKQHNQLIEDREMIGHLDNLNRDARKLYRSLVDEIRRWWDYSVLIDPAVDRWSGALPPTWRMEKRVPTFLDIDTAAPMANAQLHHETLQALRIAGGEDLGSMSMHFRLEFGGGQAAYYMSSKALDHFDGFPDQAMKFIHEVLVREFMNLWRKGR